MSKELIQHIITNTYLNQDGHIASALSVLDFMECFYNEVLTPQDTFVLSKGHASLALYAVLWKHGYITETEFFSFGQFDSPLGGHPSSRKLPVKFSAGSLGHGFPFAVGIALGRKIAGRKGRVFCLIGDGEANEGTIWESALVASTQKLDNLVCLMDFNRSGERAIKLNDCVGKFTEFGWEALAVNGHNKNEMSWVMHMMPSTKPLFLQLNTIKGKGCPIMENNPEWHHKWPTTKEEYEKIILSLSN